MKCIACGCTDEQACPGGCYWHTIEPPLCSACAESPRGHFFSDELCPASVMPELHVKIWLTDSEGYCARCHCGFAA